MSLVFCQNELRGDLSAFSPEVSDIDANHSFVNDFDNI